MKNILSSLNKSEKNRIIEMHRKATRKNYLMEGLYDPFKELTNFLKKNNFKLESEGIVNMGPAPKPKDGREVNGKSYEYVKQGSKYKVMVYIAHYPSYTDADQVSVRFKEGEYGDYQQAQGWNAWSDGINVQSITSTIQEYIS